MTPSEYFGLPVIGEIKTMNLKLSSTSQDGTTSPLNLPGATFEVIAIENGVYVTNVWHDEDRLKPQLVPALFVIDFTRS